VTEFCVEELHIMAVCGGSGFLDSRIS